LHIGFLVDPKDSICYNVFTVINKESKMNISTLEQYVEQKNKWAAMFKGRQLSLLNAEDRQRIAGNIDAELSPENLTCDGELPANQVRQRHAYLIRCAQELFSIDPTVEIYELTN
jgi:hypothetical protein